MNIRLKECRERAGLSQKQVALAINVKPPQISKWEAGTQQPSRNNCIKLAELFNVSIDYLLGNTDQQETDSQTEEMQIREMLRRNPSYRLLFDAARNAKPDHILAAAAMLKALNPQEENEE